MKQRTKREEVIKKREKGEERKKHRMKERNKEGSHTLKSAM